MTRVPIKLNALVPTTQLNVTQQREAEYLSVFNNNPVPLYIRVGSPEIPNEKNFDYIVPPNFEQGVPVHGRQFGLRLGDDNPFSRALITGTTVVEALYDEPPPVFGGVPIIGASLSTSDLTGGFISFSGNTVSQVFDLLLWGGAIITVLPSVSSGQGQLKVAVSDNGVTFRQIGIWAFWPNIPIMLDIPRSSRFMQIAVTDTGIVGEAAIAGFFGVRATLSEIAQVNYTPLGASISKAYSLAGIGTQQYAFYTGGIPALMVGYQQTGGNSYVELDIYASDSAASPQRFITQRINQATPISSQSVAISGLDQYTFVQISNLQTSAISGIVKVYIPLAPDVVGVLQNVYNALGDRFALSNNNQDIYHELDTIRQLAVSISANITTMLANQAADIASATFNYQFANVLVSCAAAYTNTGAVFPAAVKIGIIIVTYAEPGAPVIGGSIQLAFGTGAAPTAPFFGFTMPSSPTGLGPVLAAPGGKYAQGFPTVAGFTTLWGYGQANPTVLNIILGYH